MKRLTNAHWRRTSDVLRAGLPCSDDACKFDAAYAHRCSRAAHAEPYSLNARGLVTVPNTRPVPKSIHSMMHGEVRIHPLEPRLQDHITSGPIVQSFSHAVEACVTNSISAGASSIAVRISPLSLSFSVEDEGSGIPVSVLPRLAGQHSAAATRGGSLAALATTGCLTVTSKAASAFETYQVALANGRTISCGLAAQQRSTQGTMLHVTDLFHSTPVRRKQMTHARYDTVQACMWVLSFSERCGQ